MLRTSTYLGLLTLMLVLVSCGPVPLERLGLVNLTVSAEQSGSRSFTASGRASRTTAITDDQFYKEDRKEENRGTLLHQLTPQVFMLQLDDVVVYNRLGPDAYMSHHLLERSTTPLNVIIPQEYDLVHSRGIIRDALVQNSTYAGLSMQFIPYGFTGVEFPKEYDGVRFPDETTNSDDAKNFPAGLRYFRFWELQPIEINDGFLSYLTIGSDIDENYVQNPMGEIGRWTNPVTVTLGNAVALYLASDTSIDVSSYEDPELLLQWDMQNLVEIWDNKTPQDLSDDIVTYNLNNPFPVSLVVRERVHIPVDLSDDTPPSDVMASMIYSPITIDHVQEKVIAMRWLNPRDDDFSEVSIIRKTGSAPSDRSDGEEVYRRHVPTFIDTTGTSGEHYYYLIQTVDYSGNYSTGVVLDQVYP